MIALVLRGITKEDTNSGTRSELIYGCGGEVRITFSPEHTKV
jgi:hypothetical protein